MEASKALMRKALRALLISLAMVSIPSVGSAGGPPTPGSSQQVQRGAELIATRDVAIRDAKLAKGSHVTVVHVVKKKGAVVAVSLELKDGHVLRAIPIKLIRDNFRLARN